ncbi:3-phenylpropionate/trans-cinnamate dioxygenase ferredoxin subunit [Ferrithrix thermotolerans DSM 19514]|uniref:3-phenylpropionate/trans-cinnamate dioxygenase ferredoxin subunit n=1 Tax=Ferrithrix thermotolerans DSM 19514 TaxID=1121881 RepID=A0A1M4VUF9_9ACTN|nr:non-heme iron oxygenase ferredoxin subunit [Ferrithrix thermotolerans]SHE72721.1 3-phenylpropionate/trans-cinnamate dioxygenase ferredoxin subunit [Ferrithrix thermotolerans DSM 19514]
MVERKERSKGMHFVCKREDLKSGEARQFQVKGVKIAIVRIDDDFYAIGDICSHAKYYLSEGEVYKEEREIECWKHGSTFSLIDGKPQCLPATKPVPVFGVAIEGDDVFVTMERS